MNEPAITEQPASTSQELSYNQKAFLALRDELKELTKQAVHYRMQKDSARTNAKRSYYNKKIQKNSKRAAQVLLVLKNLEGKI